MLIGLLRSRHGSPCRAMCGSFWTWGSWFQCCQAGWRAGIRPRLKRIEGRAVAGARPAGISRVVCRGSRRVGGACRCRAGCRKWRRRFKRNTNSVSGAEWLAASGHGRFRAPSEFRFLRTPMAKISRQHEMGGRCTDDLGLVVVVGQAAITASISIGNHPRARRRGPGNEGTKFCARRNPRSAPSGCGVARPRGDSSTAPAMRILPCGLRPCPPVAGSFADAEREGGLIDLDQVLKQAAIRIDHGTAQLVQHGARHSCNCRARAGPGVAGRRYHSSGWSRCERP